MESSTRERIFGIGLSKTGTSSLDRAMSVLGRSTFHNPEFIVRLAETPEAHLELDTEAAAEYDCLTDLPVARFFEELDKSFPGSRFVLTTRDVDAWLASASNHFFASNATPETRQLLVEIYGSDTFDADMFRAAYLRHERAVRQHFANRPSDLLVLDVSEEQKWEKLCTFLGEDVPQVPYPFENKASTAPSWLKSTVRRHPRLLRTVRRLRGR